MFEVYENISPPVFSEDFLRRDINHNLRGNSLFIMSNVMSIFHGSENNSQLGFKIWDIVHLKLKELKSFDAFKKDIQEWQPKQSNTTKFRVHYFVGFFNILCRY